MNKYLVMYTYYDGDMSTLYSVDDEAGYMCCNSPEAAADAGINFLTAYLPEDGVTDMVIDGRWIYYTDSMGCDGAVQIRVYDEDMQEMDLRW